MLKKYLSAMIVSLGFINAPAFGQDYNPRLLEMGADELNRKLWSHGIIAKEDIQNNLEFVYRAGTLAGKFQHLSEIYDQSILQVNSAESFVSFARACREIHEESLGNIEIQTAVSMLFKKVSDKYYTQFKRLQKLERIKKTETSILQAPEHFGKADKTVPLNYPDIFEVKVN